jgi:hypothetical protein
MIAHFFLCVIAIIVVIVLTPIVLTVSNSAV